MSLNWVLLDANLKKGKARLIGTKKIDDRKLYVMEYFMEGASGALNVRLLFDIETFQHVRTQYLEVVPAKDAQIGTFNQTGNSETQLTE
jgi:hypothetical protein